MAELDKATTASEPTFVVRNLEELVALAHWPDPSGVLPDSIEAQDLEELDSIRALREIILDTSTEPVRYLSAT